MLELFRNHLGLAPIRRHKRDVDDKVFDESDEVVLTMMPRAMQYLLRLSRAIDDVQLGLATEDDKSGSRRKRDTVDNISGVIQVCCRSPYSALF